jgi:hypothetical protein
VNGLGTPASIRKDPGESNESMTTPAARGPVTVGVDRSFTAAGLLGCEVRIFIRGNDVRVLRGGARPWET